MSRAEVVTNRGASMADVARLAGVSSQTVSRVSNRQSNVTEATRQRVLQAMKTLDYRPNSAARALKYGRFRSIGVIMFNLSTYGNTRTLDAIAIAAAEAGYSLTLFPVSEPTSQGLASAFEQLNESVVDGIVLVAEAKLFDRTELDLPARVPVVLADSTAGDKYAVVDSDQRLGAVQATQHLLDLGHETVHLISGPKTSYSAMNREQAWRETLTKAGVVVPEPCLGDWSTHSGYLCGQALAARDDVTAIFAVNDQMALGAMRAFHERGIDIPNDVSIVGFDDIDEAESFWPPLTTVRQDFTGIGSTCIAILIAEIEAQSNSQGTTLIATELIVRGSTGPVRALA